MGPRWAVPSGVPAGGRCDRAVGLVSRLEPTELERALRLLGEVPDDTILRLVKLLDGLPDDDVLGLVDALSHGERCVCDLASLVGQTESAVSHQLRLLRSARLVRVRRTSARRWCAT